MKEVERTRGPKLVDVPVELIQRMQTLVPVEETARTCILNKSWLQAWSTIPTFRFTQSVMGLSKRQISKYIKLIDHTLRRYHCDNIPITSFDLHFGIKNHKSVSLSNKWVRTVISRSCLKQLYLIISVYKSFTFPDELFSGENLDRISVKLDDIILNYFLLISNNLVINCVNLRVLELIDVTISDEALLQLLSTCILLEKINISYCERLNTIKVKNLHYLRELEITPRIADCTLEIYDVPCLHSFKYNLWRVWYTKTPLVFNTDILESVRELMLDVVIKNDAYSKIISKFPSLESLTLEINCCIVNKVDISCVSLKRLNIRLWEDMQIDVQLSSKIRKNPLQRRSNAWSLVSIHCSRPD